MAARRGATPAHPACSILERMASPPQPPASAAPSQDMFLASARALDAHIEPDVVRFLRGQRHFFAVWLPHGKSRPARIHFTTPAGPLAHPLVTKSHRVVSGGSPFRGEARPRIESPAPLTLRSERKLDLTGKRLELNREIQTGDADFDQIVYLEGEAPDALVLAALSDPMTRAGVLKCLALGATEILLEQTGNLRLTLPLTSEELVTPERIAALLDALGAAAEAIPPLQGEGRHRSSVSVIPTVAVLGALASWSLFYLVDWLWKPIRPGLYWAAFFGGLLLWFVSIPLLVRLLSGRSTSLRDLATSVIALAFGFPLGGADLLLTLNAVLDGSPPEEHATQVTKLRRRTGKNSAYFVTVPSWRPGEGTVEIQINSSVYSTLAVDQRVVVTTGKGLFGWERMTTIAPAPATSPQTSR
jgi:hypothetical protein